MLVSFESWDFLDCICTYILKILDNIFYLDLVIKNLIMKLYVENFDYYYSFFEYMWNIWLGHMINKLILHVNFL